MYIYIYIWLIIYSLSHKLVYIVLGIYIYSLRASTIYTQAFIISRPPQLTLYEPRYTPARKTSARNRERNIYIHTAHNRDRESRCNGRVVYKWASHCAAAICTASAVFLYCVFAGWKQTNYTRYARRLVCLGATRVCRVALLANDWTYKLTKSSVWWLVMYRLVMLGQVLMKSIARANVWFSDEQCERSQARARWRGPNCGLLYTLYTTKQVTFLRSLHFFI